MGCIQLTALQRYWFGYNLKKKNSSLALSSTVMGKIDYLTHHCRFSIYFGHQNTIIWRGKGKNSSEVTSFRCFLTPKFRSMLINFPGGTGGCGDDTSLTQGTQWNQAKMKEALDSL